MRLIIGVTYNAYMTMHRTMEIDRGIDLNSRPARLGNSHAIGAAMG